MKVAIIRGNSTANDDNVQTEFLKQNDNELRVLDDPEDPINSKNIVDSVYMVTGNINDEITSGVIMLEIKRLLVRSIRVDNKINDVNLNSLLFGTTMQSIKTCVESIVTDRVDTHNYYRSVMQFCIASLMDIYSISTETKDASKLPAFINYFVDTFTKTSK